MLKLGFRVVWPVDRLPQLKLPSQKGNQWAHKGIVQSFVECCRAKGLEVYSYDVDTSHIWGRRFARSVSVVLVPLSFSFEACWLRQFKLCLA